MLAERRDRKAFLFPASAGMNRPKTLPNLTLKSVPRRRGDEPDGREWLSAIQAAGEVHGKGMKSYLIM